MYLAKASSALEAAFLALQNIPGAKFRLHDIIVEEVSLVDRAANKRRFLVVKRGKNMTNTKTITKEGALGFLTQALEGLVDLVNTTKDADLPANLGESVNRINALLASAMKEEAPVAVVGLSDLGTEVADKAICDGPAC